MSVLFISDLHLHPERPQITEAFFTFLESHRHRCTALYILGDLFDAWVGDDDDSSLASAVAEHLLKLANTGCALFFQHGNRDFLLGEDYAKRCNMTLLPELYALKIENHSLLIAHGDQFCTEDIAYQQFRSMVRNPDWQNEFLKKPLSERHQIAKELRTKSREANSLKAEDIMDVCAHEISAITETFQYSVLLHGHTHRPGRHTLSQDPPCERIVLGDWDTNLWYLSIDEGTIELIEEAI